MFEHVDVKGGAGKADDARFDYFCRSLWPRIKESPTPQGILLFIRSYFDFVRVRNFLRKEEASICQNHEYVPPIYDGDSSRANRTKRGSCGWEMRAHAAVSPL